MSVESCSRSYENDHIQYQNANFTSLNALMIRSFKELGNPFQSLRSWLNTNVREEANVLGQLRHCRRWASGQGSPASSSSTRASKPRPDRVDLRITQPLPHCYQASRQMKGLYYRLLKRRNHYIRRNQSSRVHMRALRTMGKHLDLLWRLNLQ